MYSRRSILVPKTVDLSWEIVNLTCTTVSRRA